MRSGYIDWKKKEAGVFEDRQWIDRHLIDTRSLVGRIYRMRIIRPLPALDAFVLEGPDKEEILLRSKDTSLDHKSGDVCLVQIIRDGYDNKLPLASESLTIEKESDTWQWLEKQRHFDPVPNELFRSEDPLWTWLNFYPDLEWICDSKQEIIHYLKDLSRFEPDKLNLVEKADFDIDLDDYFSAERRKWLARVISNDHAEIVVDRTEAASLIDVNQTANTMSLEREAKIKMVNEASISLLASAIKLQKLEGIVLIDPISMSKRDGPSYLKALKDEFYKRYLKAKVLGFTRSGLVEVLVRRGQ